MTSIDDFDELAFDIYIEGDDKEIDDGNTAE